MNEIAFTNLSRGKADSIIAACLGLEKAINETCTGSVVEFPKTYFLLFKRVRGTSEMFSEKLRLLKVKDINASKIKKKVPFPFFRYLLAHHRPCSPPA